MKKITINMNKRNTPELTAKAIWQVLFEVYRQNGGSLTNMHDMLCDLNIIEEKINSGNPIFFWHFSTDMTFVEWSIGGTKGKVKVWADSHMYPDLYYVYVPDSFSLDIGCTKGFPYIFKIEDEDDHT